MFEHKIIIVLVFNKYFFKPPSAKDCLGAASLLSTCILKMALVTFVILDQAPLQSVNALPCQGEPVSISVLLWQPLLNAGLLTESRIGTQSKQSCRDATSTWKRKEQRIRTLQQPVLITAKKYSFLLQRGRH